MSDNDSAQQPAPAAAPAGPPRDLNQAFFSQIAKESGSGGDHSRPASDSNQKR